jgi:hypothetical protein
MASVKISILPECEVFAEKGDAVKAGQLLARIEGESSPRIPLYSLLNVSPGEMAKLLLKKDGDIVRKGEVIARKGGFFSSLNIKSPISGKFQLIDDKEGFVKVSPLLSEDIVAPLAGVVVSIGKKCIELDAEGDVIVCSDGNKSIKGELFEINGENIFNIDKSVKGKIVFGRGLDLAGAAKVGVLGGAGVIISSKASKLRIPYLIMQSTVELKGFVGRKVEIFNKGGSHYLIIN